MRRIVIMGAGGRDFHNFNVVYRDDPSVSVVAFTAAQIPGIDERRYPAELAGPHYPAGIPIRPEAELTALIHEHAVTDVVFAYSDLAHEEVMHLASTVLAAGASFVLLGPDATMLRTRKPVVAVVAARTGAGKSQTSRRVASILRDAGLRVALVRHPMPYGDLVGMRVQRFATLADIDAARPTLEEREEYEQPVREGLVVFAGVDYEAVLRLAEEEFDVLVWDGGNNDFAFFRPTLTITVVDPLRPGHELRYHPGEVNLRLADVVVVNKIDSASEDAVAEVIANVRALNPDATLVRAASPVTLGPSPKPHPEFANARVLVVEDGPTLTHGGMPFGAGTVAARAAGVSAPLDPRPFAQGSIAETFARYPHIGAVLPAMGYGEAQLAELQATIEASGCDVVINGSPMTLAHSVRVACPIRDVGYSLQELGEPTLADVLAPLIRSLRTPG